MFDANPFHLWTFAGFLLPHPFLPSVPTTNQDQPITQPTLLVFPGENIETRSPQTKLAMSSQHPKQHSPSCFSTGGKTTLRMPEIHVTIFPIHRSQVHKTVPKMTNPRATSCFVTNPLVSASGARKWRSLGFLSGLCIF